MSMRLQGLRLYARSSTRCTAARPDEIAVCSTTEDVVEAVKHGRENNLRVAIRGGGHSLAGLSSIDGGMLLDLRRCGALGRPRTPARARSGRRAVGRRRSRDPGLRPGRARWRGLRHRCRRAHAGRRLRLAAAQVRPFDRQPRRGAGRCADGQIRTASEDSNPDLFWAIRGGGGNFGIVTSFTFELHPVGPRWRSRRRSTRSRSRPRSCAAGAPTSRSAPDEVTSVCVTITFPANPELPEAIHDRSVADRRRRLRRRRGGGHGGDAAAARARHAAVRHVRARRRSSAVQTGFDPLFPRNTLQRVLEVAVPGRAHRRAIDAIAAKANDRPAPLTLVNTFHMGGAIADVDPEDTAFATRVALHGLDRRHVDRRRPTTRTRWRGCARRGRTWRVRHR